MMTLKDIKVSKNRIPVQNALWIRPMGGLTFKVYYPHGGDWAEMKVDSSPSPSPTPTPTPTPTPSDTTVVNKYNNEKVIASRCIPLNAKSGSRYFFADGRMKIKSKEFTYKKTGGKQNHPFIYTYGYGGSNASLTRFANIPLLRKNNWNPVVITIKDKDYYDKAVADETYSITCERIILEGIPLYFTTQNAMNLTCDTTSPYFKVINGHLKCVAKSRMPKTYDSEYDAMREANKFVVRRLAYRGSRVRETYKWKYAADPLPDKVPISLKRQWRKVESFVSQLYEVPSTLNWQRDTQKVFRIQQIIRNRKTEKVMIRRYSTAFRGGRKGKYAVFREFQPWK